MDQLPEVPECPVCLQPYDGESTTPRVLACGHSVCEECLKQLPNPFPHTIRCPACTQLVKYPHPQGPSGLPKNIDLIRISSLLQNPDSKSTHSKKPRRPNVELGSKRVEFMPNLWSTDFYLEWKEWILPSDAVSVESCDENDGFLSALSGRISGYSVSLMLSSRCLLKENQRVSLVRIGSLSDDEDSKFVYSYVGNVMRILHGMREGQRSELSLILRASWNQCRVSKAYGLWYKSDDRCLYIVSERCSGNFLERLGDCTGGLLGGNEKIDFEMMTSFAIIGMDMCEAISSVHSQGLLSGCLAMSCFVFDDFGHVYLDINEILVVYRRVCKMITGGVQENQTVDKDALDVSFETEALETLVFVAPELFFVLSKKESDKSDSGSLRCGPDGGADVWSLACLLLQILLGNSFAEIIRSYIDCLIHFAGDKKVSDCTSLYMGWLDKVSDLSETRLGSNFVSLKMILHKCLNFDSANRPTVIDLWICIRALIIQPKLDTMFCLNQPVTEEKIRHCLVLGELCQLKKENNIGFDRHAINGLQENNENCQVGVNQVEELKVDKDLVDGLSEGRIKCIHLKGHLSSITGLAIGGSFLFSSSIDKTVNVWSLQDFTHVHTLEGHEHKVMAVVCLDQEQPLCISGDGGGGICIWSISVPFGQEPMKKLYEERDWRYSGIHALAISSTGYLYTGSGDKSVKAWSLKDYTLSCTMNGHRSVVSALAVCDGVLYSGSWDGTVRLWCIGDHSPLAVLGDNSTGTVSSVLSLTAVQNVLIVAHENGCTKIWNNNVLLKSAPAHNGAIFSVILEGKWLFTGGWDKTINVKELLEDESQVDVMSIGYISCDSVITSLLYWQGKLFVGQADRVIKVYYCRA